MGISREKNLPAHFAPLPQEEERRVGGLSIPPGHAAGVDLQKCRVGAPAMTMTPRPSFGFSAVTKKLWNTFWSIKAGMESSVMRA